MIVLLHHINALLLDTLPNLAILSLGVKDNGILVSYFIKKDLPDDVFAPVLINCDPLTNESCTFLDHFLP